VFTPRRVETMKRRRVAAVAIAAAVLLGTAACTAGVSGQPSARPVTTEEAQLLAVARFHSFDAGSRGFTAEVTERGSRVHVKGWIDYASNVGYAAVTGAFDPQAMLWTTTDVGIIPAAPDAAGDPPLPIPRLDDPQWRSRPLDAQTSRLDAVIAVVTALGADRPDNPLLVQQSGALWLRADEIEGEPVTVFAAPPNDQPLTATSGPVTADTSGLRLWIDADGLIHRADARVGTDWVTIVFMSDSAPSLELPGDAP